MWNWTKNFFNICFQIFSLKITFQQISIWQWKMMSERNVPFSDAEWTTYVVSVC